MKAEILGHNLSTRFTYKICFPGYQMKAFLLAGIHCLARASLKWYIAPYRNVGYRHNNLIWSMEHFLSELKGNCHFCHGKSFLLLGNWNCWSRSRTNSLCWLYFYPPQSRTHIFPWMQGSLWALTPSLKSRKDLSLQTAPMIDGNRKLALK